MNIAHPGAFGQAHPTLIGDTATVRAVQRLGPRDAACPYHQVDLSFDRPGFRYQPGDVLELALPASAGKAPLEGFVASSQAFVGDMVQIVLHGTPAPPIGTAVTLRLHARPEFHLPSDPMVPIILIGGGPASAPFRGFLQARKAAQRAGPAWMFLVGQSFATDVPFQDDLRAFQRAKVLTRLTLGFHPTAETSLKDRMRHAGADLLDWLARGAHIFVSDGDAGVAEQVRSSLLAVLSNQAQRDPHAAAAYLDDLRTKKRYHIA